MYLGATSRIHVEGGSFSQVQVDPSWQVIGDLGGFLVEMGDQIRLTEGPQVWSGPWPDTQISQPAVVRAAGSQAAFSLVTELSPVVGHVSGGGLAWLQIDPTPDAPGTGLGILPVIEDGRLSVFYLGLEIPSPVQPLRYYGLRCP